MDLKRALAFSQYAGRALAATPELAAELEAASALPFDWTAPAALIAGATSADNLARSLRALRRRVFLHTMVRDLTGFATLPEVSTSMVRAFT